MVTWQCYYCEFLTNQKDRLISVWSKKPYYGYVTKLGISFSPDINKIIMGFKIIKKKKKKKEE